MNVSNQPYRIHGVVIDKKDFLGLKGLRVEAWDKGLFFDKAVGFAETDEWGEFEINLDKNRFQKFFERAPELYFKVIHHGIFIENTEESIAWNQQSGDTPVRILVEKPSDDESSTCSPNQPANPPKTANPDHIIRGRLTDANKQGLAQYTVVLSEFDLDGMTQIDSIITGRYGAFEFEFAFSDDLKKVDDTTELDLVFQVYDPTGAQVEVMSIFTLKGEIETAVAKISESQKAPIVLINAPSNLTLRIVIGSPQQLPQQPQHSITEFERLVARLTPFMGKVGFADLKEDEANFQISFLSKESGVGKTKIEQLREAFQQERDSNGIPAWVFFELAAQAILITSLASMAVDKIVAMLKPSQPQCDHHSLEAIANKLLQYSKDKNIQTQVSKLKSSVGSLLQPILASEERLNTFLDAYTRHEGDTESFWQTMSQRKDFRAEVPKIQLNLQLSRLTLNNSGLIHALQQGGIKSTRQLVDLSAQKWETLALNHKEGIPPHITGKDDLERSKVYAQQLQTLVELAFPTEVIKKNVQHAEVKTFLDRNPGFDFTRTPVERYLYEQKEQAFHGIKDVKAVKTQLRKMQRLYTLTANAADMNILMDMHYDSAHQISKLSPDDFIRNLKDKISPEIAYSYHAKAVAVSDTTVMLYHQFRDLQVTHSFKATNTPLRNLELVQDNPAMPFRNKLDDISKKIPDAAPDHGALPSVPDSGDPDWRNLFGSLDLCECQHCQSVYSPAAYFVDLLNILLGQNKGAPRKEIFRRRPDLRYTKLSCEHTENLIPYIDLVNEVLETYVAQDAVGNVAADIHAEKSTNDTSGFTSSDLIANPQHPNDESFNDATKAYEKLKAAFFPLNLPFDMDLEVARQFLQEQQSSRFEVMKTFGNADSYATAAELLGISEQEFRILTLKALDGTKSAGIDEIKDLWGNPVIPATETLGEVLKKVDTFLEYTGIAYIDLISLLSTRFLNPDFPIQVYLQTLTEPERTTWLATFTDEAKKIPEIIELGGDPEHPCDLSSTVITHRDGTPLTDKDKDKELSHFNRFIRLWKKLGCTISELDGLLAAMKAKDITPQVIQELSIVWQVQQRLDLSLERMAVLIGNIPTAGEDSLFAKLFLNKAMLQILKSNPTFDLNLMQDELENSNKHLDENVPAILAAFSIPEEDLNHIANYVKLDLATDTLNLANLSKLYRYIVFAKGLRMKIKDLITWLNLIAVSPWGTATDLWNTLEQLEKLQQYGFKAADFAYIFLKERVSGNTLPPSDEIITQNAKLLREGLQKIRQENTPSDGHVTVDFLKAKLGILLEPDEVDKVIAILSKVKGDPDGSNTAALFSDLLVLKVLDHYKYKDKDILNGYLAPTDPSVLETTTDIPLRLKMYWGHIEEKLLPVLRETFVQQHLIASFKAEADIVTLMLQEAAILQVCLDVEIDTPAHTKAYAEQYILMHRFTWLVEKLKLSGKELTHFENNSNFGNFNWKTLDFKLWLRIADFAALRDSLPPAESSLLSLFETAAIKGGDITQAIVNVTAWDKINVAYFVSQHTASDFLNEIALIALQRKLALSEKIGVSIEKLESWATESVNDTQSQDIKRTLKAKYSEDAWVEVSTAVHNRLRMHLRDALVAFLLQKTEIKDTKEIKSANELYAYFLIDVEMGACMLTSRLKQAIASVQLFVQRCLLNLEEKHHKIKPSMIDAKQWEWMRLYRVWEANRKVFLHPENWIEPELRDNKSPFFKELESELLQAELTDEIAEQKLMHYLEKLDEVSRLDICGIYQDDDAHEMHVFGRTFNSPPQYFYRKLDQKTQVWTAWERVPLDIQGNEEGDSAGVHLMPVVWNRRLYLFWAIFTEKSDKERIEQDKLPYKQWKGRKNKWESDKNRVKQNNETHKTIQGQIDELIKDRDSLSTSMSFLITLSDYGHSKVKPDDVNEFTLKLTVLNTQINILEQVKNDFPLSSELEEFSELEPANEASPWAYYEVRIAWSEYREHKWSNKKISQSFVRTSSSPAGVPPTWKYNFSLEIDSTLKLKLLEFEVLVGEYQFNCNGKVTVLNKQPAILFYRFIDPKQLKFYQSSLAANYSGEAILWHEDESLPMTLITDQGENTYKVLDGSEREYKVLFPADYNFSVGLPADFIYQDHKRNYYVEYRKAWTGQVVVQLQNDKKVFVDVPYTKTEFAASPKTKERMDSLPRELLGNIDQLSPGGNKPVGNKQISAVIDKFVDNKQDNKQITSATAMQLKSAIAFEVSTADKVDQSNDHFFYYPADDIPKIYEGYNRERTLDFKPFFHAYVCAFMEALNKGGVDGLLTLQNQWLTDLWLDPPGGGFLRHTTNNFEICYQPNELNVIQPYPMEEVDFSSGGAYSLYNWELFFHVPMLIANRLSQNQRFEEARRWYHFIFNPTTIENLNSSERFWQVIPLRNTAKETLEELMWQLDAPKTDPKADPAKRQALENQISAWRDHPFNPHLIARMRLGAYAKNVAMKYLDNLIAWADSLFRQDTIEAINEATQLYILAAEMLGKRPEKIPSRVKNIALNYAELESNGLDAFSNTLVQLETIFPFYDIGPVPPGSGGSGAILNTTAPLYFCIPNNEKLMGYWDTIADRLFKIRHCQNIEGVERQLALFEPPIDPALLVRAVAGGVDIRSVLADLNSPVPYYRFNYIVQKAVESCAELKSLGNSLLAALEKKDGEALSMMRTQHETMLLNLAKIIRKLQVTEAQRSREGLEKTREVIEHRADYYAQLVKDGLNSSEKEQQTQSGLSMEQSRKGQYLQMAASAAQIAPDVEVGVIFGAGGGPTNNNRTSGGDKAAKALSAIGSYFQLLSTEASFSASGAQTSAGYQRREIDWKYQEKLATKELSQIDKQILAADI